MERAGRPFHPLAAHAANYFTPKQLAYPNACRQICRISFSPCIRRMFTRIACVLRQGTRIVPPGKRVRWLQMDKDFRLVSRQFTYRSIISGGYRELESYASFIFLSHWPTSSTGWRAESDGGLQAEARLANLGHLTPREQNTGMCGGSTRSNGPSIISRQELKPNGTECGRPHSSQERGRFCRRCWFQGGMAAQS